MSLQVKPKTVVKSQKTVISKTYQQIRLTKDKKLEEILDFLRDQFILLDDSNIFRLALSELYKSKLSEVSNSRPVKLTSTQEESLEQAMKSGFTNLPLNTKLQDFLKSYSDKPTLN